MEKQILINSLCNYFINMWEETWFPRNTNGKTFPQTAGWVKPKASSLPRKVRLELKWDIQDGFRWPGSHEKFFQEGAVTLPACGNSMLQCLALEGSMGWCPGKVIVIALQEAWGKGWVMRLVRQVKSDKARPAYLLRISGLASEQHEILEMSYLGKSTWSHFYGS